MITKEEIKNILSVNGTNADSPDEDIRSILRTAQYSEEEVAEAINLLRQPALSENAREDGLHKIFRASQALNSEEVSQLLGIDMEITETVVCANKRKGRLTSKHYSLIWGFAVLLASTGVLLYMRFLEVGPFHEMASITPLP